MADKQIKRGQKPKDTKSITFIERFQRGGVTAYSVDKGKTFHPTVRQAFERLNK